MEKKNFKVKKIQETRGFTIIETLVAISILLISTTGPLSFAQNGLKASFLARDQVTAFYLAQDAIETIKNLRDNTQLEIAAGGAEVGWLSGLGYCESVSANDVSMCNFDNTGKSTPCGPNTSCEQFDYNPTTHQFVLPGGGGGSNKVNSKYTRTIYVTEIKENQEAQVIVEVKWDSSFLTGKRIIVQENIYKKY